MRTATPLLLATGLAACSSPDAPRAPEALVDLYDRLAADGAMEIELDRDGRFLELEAEVDVADVPQPIRRAVEAAHPGVRITGAERELQGETWTWELKFEEDGRATEVVVADSGAVLEVERELRSDEAPEAVLSASERAIPDSVLVSVERITAGDAVTYHVKRSRGGARYKVVLAADGAVLRKVREAPAEIEIPLAGSWSGA